MAAKTTSKPRTAKKATKPLRGAKHLESTKSLFRVFVKDV